MQMIDKYGHIYIYVDTFAPFWKASVIYSIGRINLLYFYNLSGHAHLLL